MKKLNKSLWLLFPVFLLAVSPADIRAGGPGEEGVFQQMDRPACFPGGELAWAAFWEANLNTKRMGRKVNVKAGRSSREENAQMQFMVLPDGRIRDFKILNSIHPAIARELKRVVQLSPGWKPMMRGGKAVKSYQKQSILFIFEPEN